LAKVSVLKGKSIQIPAYILQDRSLSVLEKIVEFLKEDKSLTYHEIALLLHRDDRTIWTVYHRATQKRKKVSRQVAESKIKKTKKVVSFPSKIFLDRSLSVLEILAEHLKVEQAMTYHEIAVLLNRDDRTIWTVCNRGKTKRKDG
jgi:IS30 family transposase